ncbi:MAG: gamma-glutamyl-gamma-aminobutyrate hydrolase family protein [Burkholderiales bacterium]|nr:MAG: gamma-glutamyl-gamma-aminobutyrate hydrolase family protein [Burkholderiales bacterium]
MTHPKRPIVLLTSDFNEKGGGENNQEYRLQANYVKALCQAGAMPLVLPCVPDGLDDALRLADGVVITGSAPGVDVLAQRVDFERRLVAQCLDARLPLLGICHGMQLIGEHLGGRIVRDDPALLAKVTPHIPSAVADVLAHDVTLIEGSTLASWTEKIRVPVNSLHRHTLKPGGQYRVAAIADDGVVEAIEGIVDGFCLGVQWHPEYLLTDLDRQLWFRFVASCSEHGSRRVRVASLAVTGSDA